MNSNSANHAQRGKHEYLNTKLETNFNFQNSKSKTVFEFYCFNFEIVSKFEIRISNFLCYARLGFPIRRSSGQSSLGNSPRLIATCCVLHRCLVSRHPPCALCNLFYFNVPPATLYAQNKRNIEPTFFDYIVSSPSAFPLT